MRLASIFLHSDIILTPYPPVTKLRNPNPTICTYLFYHKSMFLLFPLWNIFCIKNMLDFFHLFLAFTQFNPVALCSDLGVKFASCCTVDDLTCHPLISHIGKYQKSQTLSQHDFFTKQNVKNPQFLEDWPWKLMHVLPIHQSEARCFLNCLHQNLTTAILGKWNQLVNSCFWFP